MAEFTLGGVAYRSKLLCAYDQWHLLSRMRPIMPTLSGLDLGLRWAGADLGEITAALAPLAEASDDDMLFVFRTCAAACRQKRGAVWVGVDPLPGMADLMRVVAVVFGENFGPLFAMKRPDFKPIAFDRATYAGGAVSMPDGNDWLFRPILATPPLCSLKDLRDGTYRIEDVALMHDALDVLEENDARARKAAEKR